MLNNEIAKLIQARILSGEYPPGQALPGQRALSIELGVSRSALREALSVLETLGLVDIRQARGVFVPDPNSQEARLANPVGRRLLEVFQFRLAMEPYAAAQASRLRTDDELEQLRETAFQMRYALSEGRLIDAAQEDFTFHRTIIAIAQNPLFANAMRSVASDMHSAQRMPLRNRGELMGPLEEHQRIIDAIAAQDAESAGAAMAAHIRAAARRAGVDDAAL